VADTSTNVFNSPTACREACSKIQTWGHKATDGFSWPTQESNHRPAKKNLLYLPRRTPKLQKGSLLTAESQKEDASSKPSDHMADFLIGKPSHQRISDVA